MAHRVVAVSSPLAEYLRTHLRVSRAKLSVIPNGIRRSPQPSASELMEVRRELKILPSDLVIGSVGRLHPIKGYDHLLDAFAELKLQAIGRNSGLVLVLVGDGEERARLERQAEALGLTRSIRFVGHREDARRLLSVMDLFVQPSKSEGTSLALLEAMAAGVAVVATAVGGTPDALGPSATDQLVEPGDQAGMVRAIGALLRDPERRRMVGQAGRVQVEAHYSFDSMAGAYHELYEEVLRGRRRHGPSGPIEHATS